MGFTESEIFTYAILPILIFLARICDVTIGTVRIIYVSRGARIAAPILGFFEVLIWIIAIGKVMQNLTNIGCYIGYAGGFAMGNFVGILIEERLAMGKVVIRVITPMEATELANNLRAAGYGATNIPGYGSTGLVSVIFSVVNRKEIKNVVEIIERFNPKAFYSIEDVRYASEGSFPMRKTVYGDTILGLFRAFRKAK